MRKVRIGLWVLMPCIIALSIPSILNWNIIAIITNGLVIGLVAMEMQLVKFLERSNKRNDILIMERLKLNEELETYRSREWEAYMAEREANLGISKWKGEE